MANQHTKHYFKAITKGVFKRLAKLTTAHKSNENAKLKDLYPKHRKALENANLTIPNTTLKEQLILNNKPRKERDKDSWNIYFCIGYSQVWEKPISRVIRRLIKSFGLTWLRCQMTTHRFSNLSEIFSGDLSAKLVKNVDSLDHLCRPCNCSAPSRINGECAYNGKCRQVGIIYEVKCKKNG